MNGIGFCLGASSVSMVEVKKENNTIKVIKSTNIQHDGNAKLILEKIICENGLDNNSKIAITGRKFRKFVNLSSISEPEAVEKAFEYVKDKYNSPEVIVSAGGETFMVYELDSNGKIINVFTGNKCASGTGEFYLQQIKRMNVDIETAAEIADFDNPLKVAGRCSVFCKSDCTHALNKGESKGKVIAGLCQMMAGKILELLKKIKSNNILLIGGTCNNKIMVDYLKKEMKNIIVADEAEYFEALGTAFWAIENSVKPIEVNNLFIKGESSFSFLPNLNEYIDRVTFKSFSKEKAQDNDDCIVGLDVGSTTTKAVIMRIKDNAILASIYLRTNGDPVQASKDCYKSLYKQIKVPINIFGIGVTGSGRQIAGLHALTEGVINEIIAHANAAIFFDPEVETIFEIGGQDAKYTYITNKVPSDYAMNEACSAGTGSFLEESAKESMGINMEEIADIALSSTNPPNFNDQCAAFISSDIKNAIQEGISKEDIVAGLVYSICQNYANRVKGNRPVGKKVFMQGGVCYNKSVPIAMAAFTGNEIIVPPEPGLMGAFGVALEIKNKIELGLMDKKEFNLKELSNRDVKYSNSFVCNGGKENCDRACNINMIEISGQKYPFGGACNKYVNIIRKLDYDCEKFDLVALREKLIFEKFAPKEWNNINAKKIGITRSLLVNSLYPLYYTFFTSLGLNVVLADKIDDEGIDKKAAPFCFPVEISHGFIQDLIKKEPDYIFLPHIRGIYMENGADSSVVCPLAQAEPYYLKSTFEELKNIKVISPMLDFSKGYYGVLKDFILIGKGLGFSTKESIKAYKCAFEQHRRYLKEVKQIGAKVINEIENDINRIGIVLFGRSYNALTKYANMGIPHKFASRGYTIIPVDFIPFESEDRINSMYWSMGQMILKASKYVKNHPRLFAAYITNFSCGPDSFIIRYFRDIMSVKPSLTLELDSHTADAGINTRIEAFLDIVKSYIQINKSKKAISDISNFKMAYPVFENNKVYIVDSNNSKYELSDKSIHILIPSMGDLASRGLAACFRYIGINATNLNPPTDNELKIGRANSSCKECLPLMLTVGGLLDYIKNRDTKKELLVYFMPTASGPCRFGQYSILMKNLIEKNKIENVALLSLSSKNGYGGLGIQFQLRAWRTVLIYDVMSEIYSALLVLAKDKESALRKYYECERKIVNSIANDTWRDLFKTLKEVCVTLNSISLKGSIHDIKKVGLIGEIFVRNDGFSRKYLVEKLAEKDIAVRVAPICEWIYYCDYLIQKNISHYDNDMTSRLKTYIQGFFKNQEEKIIKSIFSTCNLYEYNLINVDRVINNVKDIISPKLSGEAILTVGIALTEIIDEVSGIISIGPFGCMPNRVSEALISKTINNKKIKITDNARLVKQVMDKYPSLPFLSIESDGNVFPQVIQAKLEAFCLQVERIHESVTNNLKYNDDNEYFKTS